MLTQHQVALLAEKSGGADPVQLVAWLRACGFDGERYLTDNPGLRRAGLDAVSAPVHFLTYGYQEHREVSCGVFPDGIEQLHSLAIPDRHYATRLFASVFFGQIRNQATTPRLWNDTDRMPIEYLQAMGGIPYFVIGDSHTLHFVQRAWIGERWLAGLPLPCHGGAAIELPEENSRLGYGMRILRWARTAAPLLHRLDVPVLLKFGGIDAEFLWMRRRLKSGVHKFSVGEFADFAERSISGYGRFLDMLTEIIDPGLLRIYSAFPSVLSDSNWSAGFLRAHHVSPERDLALAEQLSQLEIPPLLTRTQLRGLYNDYLRDLCRAKALVFVDVYSPLLDSRGNTAEACYAAHGGRDFHVDYSGCQEALAAVIERSIERSGLSAASPSG